MAAFKYIGYDGGPTSVVLLDYHFKIGDPVKVDGKAAAILETNRFFEKVGEGRSKTKKAGKSE